MIKVIWNILLVVELVLHQKWHLFLRKKYVLNLLEEIGMLGYKHADSSTDPKINLDNI